MNNKYLFTVLTIMLFCPIYAYIGPGASAGLIATILGIIGSIFLQYLAYFIIRLKDF